ncbi:eukaryotic aspartyl protease [Thozetella sp. PMI_491]|nr:eukaryotic aspartyl protease [Thozetella sp. PMI_491]
MFTIINTLSLAAMAGQLGLATATPILDRSPNSFTVAQVPNVGFKRSGLLEVAKTHLKFRKPIPGKLQGALIRRQSSGSVVASPQPYDLEYLCPVSVGTPAQVVNLDFDTGSADLWITSPLGSTITGQKAYHPIASRTSSLSPNIWSITYGDGSSATGAVFKDVVQIGGVSYAKQAVEVAVIESDSFLQNPAVSGLLGLAFSSINQVQPTKQNTFFDNIKPTLAMPVFGVNLKYNASGSYDFGFINPAVNTSSLANTTVDSSQGFWGFTASGYQIGSGEVSNISLTGIADTGTTLLYLPVAVVQAYYSNIAGAADSSNNGGWVFPCNAALPSFTYRIGNTGFTIPDKYLNYAPIGDGTCFGGIQDDSSIGFSIFGDIALKAAYIVFDGSVPQLRWGAKTL